METGYIYLTEDKTPGLIYRFVSDSFSKYIYNKEESIFYKPEINKGILQALK